MFFVFNTKKSQLRELGLVWFDYSYLMVFIFIFFMAFKSSVSNALKKKKKKSVSNILMLPYGWGRVLQNAIIKVNKPLFQRGAGSVILKTQ